MVPALERDYVENRKLLFGLRIEFLFQGFYNSHFEI